MLRSSAIAGKLALGISLSLLEGCCSWGKDSDSVVIAGVAVSNGTAIIKGNTLSYLFWRNMIVLLWLFVHSAMHSMVIMAMNGRIFEICKCT